MHRGFPRFFACIPTKKSSQGTLADRIIVNRKRRRRSCQKTGSCAFICAAGSEYVRRMRSGGTAAERPRFYHREQFGKRYGNLTRQTVQTQVSLRVLPLYFCDSRPLPQFCETVKRVCVFVVPITARSLPKKLPSERVPIKSLVVAGAASLCYHDTGDERETGRRRAREPFAERKRRSAGTFRSAAAEGGAKR